LPYLQQRQSQAVEPESKAMSGISRDLWLRAVEESGLGVVDDQGAITIAEFAEMFNPPIHRSSATRRMRLLVQNGRAVQTKKNISDGTGRIYNQPAYRLVDETPTKKARKRR
jgi:hypothetical protein